MFVEQINTCSQPLRPPTSQLKMACGRRAIVKTEHEDGKWGQGGEWMHSNHRSRREKHFDQLPFIVLILVVTNVLRPMSLRVKAERFSVTYKALSTIHCSPPHPILDRSPSCVLRSRRPRLLLAFPQKVARPFSPSRLCSERSLCSFPRWLLGSALSSFRSLLTATYWQGRL